MQVILIFKNSIHNYQKSNRDVNILVHVQVFIQIFEKNVYQFFVIRKLTNQ